ncbi:hypothetical protein [Chitinophaga niabensis]|nr:hypothetical protein [Chitinophaga niabensis]
MKTIQPKTWRLWAGEIITALLLVFFVHSAIDNYLNLLSLKNLLWFYTKHVGITAWFIVFIEAGIAILLFFPKTRIHGLAATLLFVIILATVVLLNPHSPHLFGGILNKLGKRFYLPFEIFLFLITLLAIGLNIRRKTAIQPKAIQNIIVQ